MKTKLLLISVRADFGGGPKHVDQLVRCLRKDYNVYVASPYEEPYGVQWSKDTEISGFVTIPHRRFYLKDFFRLVKFVKAEKIQIIHSHGKGAGVYSRLIKVLCVHVKVVHTFHGLNANYGKWLNCVYLGVEKVLSLLTDQLIFVSHGERSKALKMGLLNDKKSNVIFNGIEDVQLSGTHQKSSFRIVSISRFDYAKNMDLAYEIAFKFKDDDRIQFVWVGDGHDKERLKTKAMVEGVNIDFVGFTNNPIKYLHDSDILLSSSRFEGLPYALIEASSAGLPIVASNVVGNNDIVKNGCNGFLFDSVQGACDSIRILANDLNLRSKMRKAARDEFEANYSEAMMIRKLELLYELVLSE